MLFKDRTFINKVLGADSEGFKKLINNCFTKLDIYAMLIYL